VPVGLGGCDLGTSVGVGIQANCAVAAILVSRSLMIQEMHFGISQGAA
jgi:hypothetical protein